MSKLRSALKWLLFAIVVVAITWLIAGVWWQTTHRVVTVDDAIIYLGVLPVALNVLIVFGIWIRKKRNAAPAQGSDAPSNSTVTADPGPVQDPPLVLLSAWAISPAGTTAAEYAEALSERSVRPSPDKTLTDDHGFPVLSGRVPDLDTSRLLAWLESQEIVPADEWRQAFVRALALLDKLLEQVVDEWVFPPSVFWQSLPSPDAGISTLRGTPAPTDEKHANKLEFHVQLLIPDHFQERERLLAEHFLSDRITALRIPHGLYRHGVISAADNTAAFALIDRFRTEASQSPDPQALLILAADSALCPSAMEEWSARGHLFLSGKHPNGLMPGEGAFGALYVNEPAAELSDADPLCLQAPSVFATRETSADDKQRPTHACMAKVASEALRQAGISGESIAALACDADHRTSRALECAGMMLNETPHLDAIQHRLATNEACGHLGAASALSALVAGAMQAATTAAPLLVAHVSHPTERAATVLLPSTDMAPT